MFYLLTFFFLFVTIYTLDRSYGVSKYLISCIFIFGFAIIPSAQLSIGTDYFSYLEHYKNGAELYLYNKEYLFYFINYLVKVFDISPQYVFVLTSFIQASTLALIILLLKEKKYSILIVFFLYFFVSNMYHNQMNVLRSYLSIYFGIYALLSRFRGDVFLPLVFFSFALISHKIAFIYLPFLLFTDAFYKAVYRNLGTLLLVASLLAATSIPYGIIEDVVKIFIPRYSNYFEAGANVSQWSLVNLLTKLYYLPLVFIFFVFREEMSDSITDFDKKILVVGSIGFVLIIVAYTNPVFSRLIHYFIFFSIFFYYWVLKFLFEKNFYLYVIGIMYLLFPYVIKVVILPSKEFLFETIVF
ncbi:EpsG family protein [Enterovibrio norvegicus]|uniref:EpsG family protein n=1 Tax=Enterovibrio norvegicus TaxID=188144 RepID=A0ABV4KY06_9GAMM|nr:hypothetical protein A1OU_11675 [Enterovibrio norvegicus]